MGTARISPDCGRVNGPNPSQDPARLSASSHPAKWAQCRQVISEASTRTGFTATLKASFVDKDSKMFI